MFTLTGFCFLLATIVLSTQSTYKAALVEYNTRPKISNFDKYVDTNVKNYVEFIKAASFQNADIIVFPKSTINDLNTTDRTQSTVYASEIPDPLQKITPCNSNQRNEILNRLSCQAKTSQVYILINLIEKSCNKEKCSSVDYNLFSSNVVFNRKGQIISRYRTLPRADDMQKRNFELSINENNNTIEQTMELDQIFDKLSYDLLTVKDFSEYWMTKLPILTATQYKDNWAYSSDISDIESQKKNNKVYFFMHNTRTDNVEVENYETIFYYIMNKIQIVSFVIILYFLEMM
ncbi:vanin-like protein 1 [Arctopsyche grandis]|uniref:vanin-like protein 1 n=1 Tax=Arctopsyche grandis TaxID=121162 RepID=UPI00406D869D